MASFEDFWDSVKERIEELTEGSWNEFADAIKADGNAFFEGTKEDLKRWTKLLTNGQITKDEYEFLVSSKKDLMELEALRQAGLTKIRLQRIQDSLIDIIVDTSFDTFLE